MTTRTTDQGADRPPAAHALDRSSTLAELFLSTASERATAPAIRTFGGGGDGGGVEWSWTELREIVAASAAGLAGRRLGRGSTVATMLVNRPEVFVVELAALTTAVTPFALYVTAPAEQIAYVFDNSDVELVVTQERFRAVVEQAVRLSSRSPEVIVLSDTEQGRIPELEAGGADDFDLAASVAGVRSEDIALISYTSGTTGPPKGVQLTHRNILAIAHMLRRWAPQLVHAGSLLSYLPMAHIGDRLYNQYASLAFGATINVLSDPRRVAEALPVVRPDFFLAMPRIWEKFRAALAAAVPPGRRPDEPEVAQSLRDTLGLKPEALLITGGAPIPDGLMEFFDGIGVTVHDGYGMTETVGGISGTMSGDRRPGSVGKPSGDMEVKIADDGELLVRSASMLMAGYRKMSDLTAESYTGDGWFRTGDLARLDDEGYLYLQGRKKDLIITSTGENVAPSAVESAVRAASDVVGPMIVVGDGEPFVSAIISADPDELRRWAAANGREELSHAELVGLSAVQELVAGAVEDANRRLARHEQVRAFRLVPDVWDPASSLVTPTLKIKRKQVVQHYEREIASMYAGAGQGTSFSS